MKVKYGSFIVDGSGKINGHVASRNRGGAYLRTKVTPLNPNTSFQTVIRNRLTSISQSWRTLTQEQRDSWNAAVASFSRTDIFGDIKSPTGFNLHQRLNNELVQVGEAVITSAPQPTEVSTVLLSSIAAAAGAGTVAVTLSGAVPAGTAMKILSTPGLSAGVNFVKSEYRQISVEPALTASPVAAGADYVAKFGGLVEGTKIFVAIEFVNTTTGQVSSRQVLSAIVAA